MTGAHRAVELVARESYGQLVAWLASRCRDLQLAEDAVAEALEAALREWPEGGVPDRPFSWLLTVSRRRVIDRQRREQTAKDGAERLRIEAQEVAESPFLERFPERRLELMLVCAHPEIPEDMRTPLMLQSVLGLSADRIGSAMLVKPSTMGQRLSRVKRRIKELRLEFCVPPSDELALRLGYLLDAVYAAFGAGWEESNTGLAEEAIWLARLTAALVPESAEAKGLLSLLLHCEARRAARRTDAGEFVPLDEQDPARWNRERIGEAERVLWAAARQQQRGPYQLEAAIQSLHAHRARSGTTDWRRVNALYLELDRDYPSVGVSVGLAASFGRVGDAGAGLAQLDRIPSATVKRHQPYWAVRAHLLAKLGRSADARSAFDRATGLTEDPAVREWLGAKRDAFLAGDE